MFPPTLPPQSCCSWCNPQRRMQGNSSPGSISVPSHPIMTLLFGHLSDGGNYSKCFRESIPFISRKLSVGPSLLGHVGENDLTKHLSPRPPPRLVTTSAWLWTFSRLYQKKSCLEKYLSEHGESKASFNFNQ